MATEEPDKNKLIQFLQPSQINLLNSKGLTAEELIFNSCSKLRIRLQDIQLSESEIIILKKLRKRGREKWLHIRDCNKIVSKIEEMNYTITNLKSEKVSLGEEINHLKIKCFLADKNLNCCPLALNGECELLHDDNISIDDVLQCLKDFS